MDQSSLAGSKAAARHTIGSMPANSAPVCESIRAADGTEVTESAGITTVFREHYKQLVPHWCAEFDADNYDRVTAKVQDWVASQVPSGMQSATNPHQRRWNAQSRTCRHTKLANR
jgi:hypothetical protein